MLSGCAGVLDPHGTVGASEKLAADRGDLE